jgi:hypothetical protein
LEQGVRFPAGNGKSSGGIEMTTSAEDLPVSPVLSIGLSSSLADITFDANFGSTSVSFRARPWSGLPCREIRTLA